MIYPIRFDCTALMYTEIKALFRYGDNIYNVYYSECTMQWVFGNGDKINEYALEDYINKHFQMSYVEKALDWFSELARNKRRVEG